MPRKTRVGLLFGGKSAEHEVSLQSARNIYEAIDRDKYEVILIGIDKSGKWILNNAHEYLLNADDPARISLNKQGQDVTLVAGRDQRQLVALDKTPAPGQLDVVFPVLHGPMGEDGTIQGLLKLANLPFVGAGVLGSAVGMDKDVMKRLLRDAGLPIGDFSVVHRHELKAFDAPKTLQKLGSPVFVKPANMGSSVGVSRAEDAASLMAAVEQAFAYDRKVVIERFIPGREIECSVLGNEAPIASLPGEILPAHQFYSYEAKYIDAQGARLQIPAEVTKAIAERLQQMAVAAFKVLCCEGLARVDFFLTPDDQIVINEINTMPGFTRISMYPKMWEATGIAYSDLIERLIELAIDRYAQESRLKTSRD